MTDLNLKLFNDCDILNLSLREDELLNALEMEDGILNDFEVELKGYNYLYERLVNTGVINKDRLYYGLNDTRNRYPSILFESSSGEEIRVKNKVKDLVAEMMLQMEDTTVGSGLMSGYFKIKHIFGGEVEIKYGEGTNPFIKMTRKKINENGKVEKQQLDFIPVPNVYMTTDCLCLGEGGRLSELRSMINREGKKSPKVLKMAYDIFFNNYLNNDLLRNKIYELEDFFVIMKHVIEKVKEKEDEGSDLFLYAESLETEINRFESNVGWLGNERVTVTNGFLLAITTYMDEDILLYI